MEDRKKIKSHLKIEESDEELDPEEIVRRAETDPSSVNYHHDANHEQ